MAPTDAKGTMQNEREGMPKGIRGPRKIFHVSDEESAEDGRKRGGGRTVTDGDDDGTTRRIGGEEKKTGYWNIEDGLGQGCAGAVIRSKYTTSLIQRAVGRLCERFEYEGQGEVGQTWFADDGAFCAENMAGLQLWFDVVWVVTRLAGLDLIVKPDGSKTAWSGTVCVGGVWQPTHHRMGCDAAEQTNSTSGKQIQTPWMGGNGDDRQRGSMDRMEGGQGKTRRKTEKGDRNGRKDTIPVCRTAERDHGNDDGGANWILR